ncbi:MAG: glycosyltransferase family 4 protein [Anaerolineales bacterium]|nr:glycosyltransferase family 4 protein [Anaerolineales bacterium]
MHILLIHQAFAALDEPGGTRHHELARYLSRKGHRVTIIASPVSYLTGEAANEHIPWMETQDGGEGVTILRAYTYPALHRSFMHRVLSFFSFMFSSFFISLRVKHVDLVWGTSPPIFQGATAWAVARLKRVPLLFEVRDLWPAFAVAVGVLRNKVLIRASQWLERFLYRHANLVVVNSPGFTSHVRERGAQRVELVPNGADTSMFNPQADGLTFRHVHGLEGEFVGLYAGAHGMSNDLNVVLDAAKLLQDEPHIIFVLLGAGKEKLSLLRRAEVIGITNVRFLSPVPKNKMPEALAAADACIAILKPVELYKTVYPNKVFDYMAAGRPVILAMQGVIQEVVEDAGAGIPIKPGDPTALAEAMRKLAADPHLRHEMGMRGRHCVESHFDRSVLAGKMLELMEGLLDKG